MDYNDMKTFLAVAQSGSISSAASVLFLSQSTISYRIRVLEEELGITLFERGQGIRTTQLTAAGERLMSYAEQWVYLYQRIQCLKETAPSLDLQIGSVDSVNLFILRPLYDSLSRQYPSARIRIRTQQSHEIYHMLERGELNVGFVLRKMENPYLNVTPILREKMHLVRKRDGHFGTGPVYPEELNPKNELYIEWSPEFCQWHNTWWDPSIPPYLFLDSVPLMRGFFAQPQFWAICPETVVRALKEEIDIETLPLTNPPPDRITYLVTPKVPNPGDKRNLDAFCRLLDDYCSEAFKDKGLLYR